MNDDQLRSELERRADAASPRPDWPKPVLLPAVWREIDARPQPAISSRLSPKWSVVGIVVALLFLIVAVPRLVQQVPSGTANPSASPVPSPSLAADQIRLTCDAQAGLGYCLGRVAWAVEHLPSGLAPVAAVAIMDIDLCPDTSPRASCAYAPHHYEWWAQFTLRDGSLVGMHVSNTMGFDSVWSAVVGATPPASAQPVSGEFTLDCGQIDDAICTGAAGGSSDLSPNKPPRTVSVEPFAATAGHYAVTLNFEDGTTATVEVAPDAQRDIGWSSVRSAPSSTEPSATSSPVADRTIECGLDGSSPISVIDHSGLMTNCSVMTAALVPDQQIVVGSAGAPASLEVTWSVYPRCPTDDQLEFWKVAGTNGFPKYVLQVDKVPTIGWGGPWNCGTVGGREVVVEFMNPVSPGEVWASTADIDVGPNTIMDTASATVDAGTFDLTLEAPVDGLMANAPLEITSTLTYNGDDAVAISGDLLRPDFLFTSLTGGPTLNSYGSILMCSGHLDISPGQSIDGELVHPRPETPADPNYDYFKQYAYDNQFRLPEGTYLIYSVVDFFVGVNCDSQATPQTQPEPVRLRAGIVIHVDGAAGSP